VTKQICLPFRKREDWNENKSPEQFLELTRQFSFTVLIPNDLIPKP
jgi:hypothetical protein